MKKIINGKLYDTSTAEKIDSWRSGRSPGDFNYIAETLYVTPSKAFFLHGTGGAATEYAELVGSRKCGSETIVTMTSQEAMEWCEQRDVDADIYQKYFDVTPA